MAKSYDVVDGPAERERASLRDRLVCYRDRLIRICTPRFCGPNLSACGLILSVWGVVQLTLMGVCLHVRSVDFLEDLSFEFNVSQAAEGKMNLELESEYFNSMEIAYEKAAINCFVAALLYLVLLVVSAHQVWVNNRITQTTTGNSTGFTSQTVPKEGEYPPLSPRYTSLAPH
jgi:ribonuclease kappa